MNLNPMNPKNLKPYVVCVAQRDGYRHAVELMSFPIPGAALSRDAAPADATIMARRVPGHPGTLEELPTDILESTSVKHKWVHYAKVRGTGQFPVDMLRYDFAAPVNFVIGKNWTGPRAGAIDPSFGFDGLVIAQCTPNRNPTWTPARWASFLWRIDELTSQSISDAVKA
jgi:hypothetical protein